MALVIPLSGPVTTLTAPVAVADVRYGEPGSPLQESVSSPETSMLRRVSLTGDPYTDPSRDSWLQMLVA
ncbi:MULTISPECIES: hypothetical protein [unclassified Nocardiopsis]|uniref:hypothetical protein n=1 Tax=Nocardiopsis TaxID=2013 RepID=UPI00387B07EF